MKDSILEERAEAHESRGVRRSRGLQGVPKNIDSMMVAAKCAGGMHLTRGCFKTFWSSRDSAVRE